MGKTKETVNPFWVALSLTATALFAGCSASSVQQEPRPDEISQHVSDSDENLEQLLLNMPATLLDEYELRVSKTEAGLAIFEVADRAANEERAEVALGESATLFGITFQAVDFVPANLDTSKGAPADALELQYRVLANGGEITHPAYSLTVGDERTVERYRGSVRAGNIWLTLAVDDRDEQVMLRGTRDDKSGVQLPIEQGEVVTLFDYEFEITELSKSEAHVQYVGPAESD